MCSLGYSTQQDYHLEEERKITTEQGQAYAEKVNASFIETSAKTPHNVDELFIMMAEKLMKSVPENPPENNGVDLNSPHPKKVKRFRCLL